MGVVCVLNKKWSSSMMDVLKPLVVVMALFYGYGSPNLSAWRPDALDLPLQNFRKDMDKVAVSSKRLAEVIKYETTTANGSIHTLSRATNVLSRELGASIAMR
jgi:hypothetical protein